MTLLVITQQNRWHKNLLLKQVMESSFWSNLSFWERGNFSLKHLNTVGLKPFLGTWKHNNLCKRVFFISLFSRNLKQLTSKFHRFVILCICWDTPKLEYNLWNLPNMSSAFNQWLKTIHSVICRIWLLFVTQNTWSTDLHVTYTV